MITVYILKLNNGKYYTGMTNDLPRRLREHQYGYSKSTQYYLPVQLIHSEVFPDRKKARRREIYIKFCGAKKYLLRLKYVCSAKEKKSVFSY